MKSRFFKNGQYDGGHIENETHSTECTIDMDYKSVFYKNTEEIHRLHDENEKLKQALINIALKL